MWLRATVLLVNPDYAVIREAVAGLSGFWQMVMVVVSGGDRESCHLQVLLRLPEAPQWQALLFPRFADNEKSPLFKSSLAGRAPTSGPRPLDQGYDLSLLARAEAILLLDELPPGLVLKLPLEPTRVLQ